MLIYPQLEYISQLAERELWVRWIAGRAALWFWDLDN